MNSAPPSPDEPGPASASVSAPPSHAAHAARQPIGYAHSAATTPRQPRPGLRWLGFVLAAGAWFISLQLLGTTGGLPASGLLDALCGPPGSANDCSAVLTSPQAYIRFGSAGLPVAAIGMAYFAVVAMWYLFVGPASYRGRGWHAAVLLLVIAGALGSANFIRVMAVELHRWCGGCLVAHGLNFALLLVTVIAWPWRSGRHAQTHPTARLALATLALGVSLVLVHLEFVYLRIASNLVQQRTARYEEVLGDPEFILWDYHRQAPVEIPLALDEFVGGNPDAPHTVVVFGDFQCTACRQAHEMLMQVAQKYAGQIRVAFRHYPQDPACNPDPRYVAGGHYSACRAARAAEAAGIVGGQAAYLAMRKLLWERQSRIPQVPVASQSETQLGLFTEWAAELGLNRAAFRAALDGPATAARIARDLELAQRIDIQAVPVLYLDGRRLRNWSKLETWDALLGAPSAASQPSGAAPGR